MGLTFIEQRRTINILGWPSDVISIDPKPNFNAREDSLVHTIILWVPGNPGQHDWYHSDFMDVLSTLGHGYAVRSVSHAGHGLSNDRNHSGIEKSSIIDVEDYCRFRGNDDGISRTRPFIPWTVEGQILHKIAYVDILLSSIEEDYQRQNSSECNHKHEGQHRYGFVRDPKIIMVGHSFGCHVIQRMCVLRPDVLEKVSGSLFLMPYIRTKPSFVVDQRKLDFGGLHSDLLISTSTKFIRTMRCVPDSILRSAIRKGLGNSRADDDDRITAITAHILRNPVYPRNFFELGTEELRDIPNEIDITALRLLSSYRRSSCQNTKDSDFMPERPRKKRHRRPIFILYAGDNDQWCPSFHEKEIKAFQTSSLLPPSIQTTKINGLRHDYVCQNRRIRSKVSNWISSKILEMDDSIISLSNSASDNSSHESMDKGSDDENPRSTDKILSKL